MYAVLFKLFGLANKGTVPRSKRRELLVRENTSKRVFRASVKEVDKNDGNT